MKIEIIDNKAVIIITAQEILNEGKEQGVDMTMEEATQILERIFVGHNKNEDFEPTMEQLIASAVHWETDTRDCYWSDDDEREGEIKAKILTYKGLVYDSKIEKFRKRVQRDDELLLGLPDPDEMNTS